MPRRRYYRRYTRVVPAKKKWASCIKQGQIFLTEEEQSEAGGYMTVEAKTLCLNAQDMGAPTPVILKTGNFKVQFDGAVEGIMDPLRQVVMFLMFIPEGVNPTGTFGSGTGLQSIADKHPEWIMGWKRIDTNSSVSQGAQSTNVVDLRPTSFSSRLKRNLNSGDSIYLVLVSSKQGATVASGSSYSINIQYTCQFWTCSN